MGPSVPEMGTIWARGRPAVSSPPGHAAGHPRRRRIAVVRSVRELLELDSSFPLTVSVTARSLASVERVSRLPHHGAAA